MLELPEAAVIAGQLNETVASKKILKVMAAHTPHKFAWFSGDPQSYHPLLAGQTIVRAAGYGSMVEIKTESAMMVFGDGVGLRYHGSNETRPNKHQLLIEFENGAAVSATVQMYGGLWCSNNGNFDNVYYRVAKEKPSPLVGQFNEAYFEQLITIPEVAKLSAKACLATEQRIPGLGNGVLQDILWTAGIHPKRKISTLSEAERAKLLITVKSILTAMTEQGGRNTEKDLYGKNGGYQTVMCKNNTGLPCPHCGNPIKKETYLGGSIYFCGECQQ